MIPLYKTCLAFGTILLLCGAAAAQDIQGGSEPEAASPSEPETAGYEGEGWYWRGLPLRDPPPSIAEIAVGSTGPSRRAGNTKTPKVLRLVGWIMFAASYAPMLIAGGFSLAMEANKGGYLMIPVAGPLVFTLKTFESDDDYARLPAFWFTVVGVIQLTGLALAVSSIALKKRRSARWRISVAPIGPRGSGGMSMVATF